MKWIVQPLTLDPGADNVCTRCYGMGWRGSDLVLYSSEYGFGWRVPEPCAACEGTGAVPVAEGAE